MFSKIEVNGKDAHPVYQYLRSNSKLFNDKKEEVGVIPWNFAKFLVDRTGKVYGFYEPTVSPVDLSSKIEALLE